MSIKRMAEVWENSAHKAGALLVLLALADFANDQGVCWPSFATLARKARISERQAKRIVAQLVKSGELALLEKGGMKRKGLDGWEYLANTFQVIPKGGDIMPPGGVTNEAGGGCHPCHPNHHKEPSIGAARRLSSKGGGRKRVNIRFGAPAGSIEGLESDLQAYRRELHGLLHPGGCAQIVRPGDPAKRERAEYLAAAISEVKAAIKNRKAA